MVLILRHMTKITVGIDGRLFVRQRVVRHQITVTRLFGVDTGRTIGAVIHPVQRRPV